MLSDLKCCARCREEKPRSEFGPQREAKDGLKYWCRACSNQSIRAYWAAHPEKLKENNRRYRTANPEKVKEYRQDWYTAHREEVKERTRAYRVAHPDKVKEYMRAWYAANREKVKETNRVYRATHLEMRREAQRRRHSRERAAFVENVELQVLFERDKGHCGICGQAVKRTEASIDHILPLSCGGEHSYANTRLTHLRCNIRRGNRGEAQPGMIG